MRNTTLCYIERGQQYLMLHRVKKENDLNHDKWVGIGGKFEEGESPEECLRREVYEETGLRLLSHRFHGIVTFVSDRYETEYMHLYTSDCYTGTLHECAEGELAFIPRQALKTLPMWQGDALFFALLQKDAPPFSLKLCYCGETLVSAALDGTPCAASDEREQ